MSKIFNIETGPDWSQIPEDHIVVVQDRDKTIITSDKEMMFDEKDHRWVLVEDLRLGEFKVEFHYPEIHRYLELHPEYKTKIWRRN